jgi:outer membrane protein TolC
VKIRKAAVFLIILCLSGVWSGNSLAEEILTWQDCLAEAKKNHPDLISAVETINEEKAGKAIAASGLYPQIEASLGASTAETEASDGTKTTTDSYSYGLSGRQLIFDGFQTINDIKTAGQNLKVAEENYRFVSSQIRLDLRTAFINLLKAQELVRVTEDIVKIRRDSLMLITLRYESGLEHKGALLTAQANLADAAFGLAQAKRDIEFAQRQLTKEMGRREFKPLSVKGDFTVREAAKEKPDFGAIAKNNPSVLQAAYRKNSAVLGVQSAYGNFAPEISGSASTAKSSAHWPPENDRWSVGLSLSMPIFECGLKTAQLSQAKALYNQAQANELSIRDTVIVNLQRAWVALQDAIETVQVRSKSLEAALERSRIAEAQYSTGFINFDNWIIIENDLVSAKKNYLQAQASALLAEAGWIQAKGETLEYAQ